MTEFHKSARSRNSIDPAREDSHDWGDIAADLRAIDIWIGSIKALNEIQYQPEQQFSSIIAIKELQENP